MGRQSWVVGQFSHCSKRALQRWRETENWPLTHSNHLIVDTGESGGMYPFISDFVDYNDLQILVIEISNTRLIFVMVTMAEKLKDTKTGK